MNITKGIARWSVALVLSLAPGLHAVGAPTAKEQEAQIATAEELQTLYMQAVKARRQGMYPQALDGFTQSLAFAHREFGDQSAIYLLAAKALAEVYEDLAQAEKAESLLLALYKSRAGAQPEDYGPLEEEPLRLLANFYLRQGDFANAEKFSRALYRPDTSILDPEYHKLVKRNCYLQSQLGSIYEASENWQAAEAVFQECLSFVPQGPDTPLRLVYRRLASAKFKLGATQEAVAMLETSIAAYEKKDGNTISQDQADARLRLAKMYIDLGKFGLAYAQVNAVNQQPNKYGNNESTIFNSAWMLSAQGLVKAENFAQALDILHRITPNFERIYTPKSLEVAALYEVQIDALRGMATGATSLEEKQQYERQATDLTTKSQSIRRMTGAERKTAVSCFRQQAPCSNASASAQLPK